MSGFLSDIYDAVASSRADWEALHDARAKLRDMVKDVKALEDILSKEIIPYILEVHADLEIESPYIDIRRKDNSELTITKSILYKSRSRIFTLQDRKAGRHDEFTIQQFAEMRTKLAALLVGEMQLSLDHKFKIVSALDKLKIKAPEANSIAPPQPPLIVKPVAVEPEGFTETVARLKGHAPA